MPIIGPLQKKAEEQAVLAIEEEEETPTVNQSYQDARELVDNQIPIAPEAGKVDPKPVSLTTSTIVAPIPSELELETEKTNDALAQSDSVIEMSDALADLSETLDTSILAQVSTVTEPAPVVLGTADLL